MSQLCLITPADVEIYSIQVVETNLPALGSEHG